MNLDFIEILKTYPKHSQPNPAGFSGGPPPGVGAPPPGSNSSTTTTVPDTNPPAGGVNDEGYNADQPFLEDSYGVLWPGAWHRHQDGTYAKGFAADHTIADEFLMDSVLYEVPPPPPPSNITGTTTGAAGGNTSPPKVTSPIGVSTVPTSDDSNVPSQGPPPPDPPPPPIPDLDSDLVVEYNTKGLLWKSTDPLVGRRDPAGNLIYFSSGSDKVTIYPDPAGIARNLQDGSILIEGIMENIDRQSYMETIKTSFEYFKFPATTKVNEFITIPELDEVTLDLETADELMYIRLKPSQNRDILVAPDTTSLSPSGILLDEVVDGDAKYLASNSGIQITPEFKESGADLRIQVKVTHKYNSDATIIGQAALTLIKFSPGVEDRDFRIIYEQDHSSSTSAPGSNTTYDAQNEQSYGTAGSGLGRQIRTNYQKYAFAEWVIPNNQFQSFERITIGAIALEPGHEISAFMTYMIAADASLMETPDGQDISLWRQMNNRFYSGTGVIIG